MKLRNQIIRILLETLQEDYPVSFDMEEFKSINTFAERVRYCEARLERIAQGSSRIVYRIDQQMVLKLAKNTKGLAQNQAEVDFSEDSHLDSYGLISKVYNYHPQFHWLEVEAANKVTPSKFKEITGFNWKDFQGALHDYGFKVHGRRGDFHSPSGVDPEVVEAMWEDHDFVYQVFDYIGNFEVPTGDLVRISSWGWIQRPEGPEMVLVDYGLTQDVADTHYAAAE
ncbi:MAG: hypothetical protein P8J32_07475 [bacterium]|nr:hypothetical protein [bacterium]